MTRLILASCLQTPLEADLSPCSAKEISTAASYCLNLQRVVRCAACRTQGYRSVRRSSPILMPIFTVSPCKDEAV